MDEDLDIAGELKPLDVADDKRAATDKLNVHRGVIIRLAADVAEGKRALHEKTEATARMLAEMEERMGALQGRVGSSEYVPLGNGRDALARYGRFVDGKLEGVQLVGAPESRLKNLGQEEQRDVGDEIPLPGGGNIHVAQRGYLTDPYPATIEQLRVQRAYQALGVAVRVARTTKDFRGASLRSLVTGHKGVRNAWVAFVRSVRSAEEPVGRMTWSALQRVLNGAAGKGTEWVETPELRGAIGPVDLANSFVGRFPVKEAPGQSFSGPTIPAGEMIAKKRGRVSSDQPSAFPLVNQTTSSRSITIASLVLRLLIDSEWLKDFERNGLLDMATLSRLLRRGMFRSLVAAIIHGDTTATHEDTLSTWTMGGLVTAGAYDSDDSPLKLWKGIRRKCRDNSTTNDAGQTFSGTTAMAMLARMGARAHSENLFWLTSLHCLYTQIMADDDFRTVQTAGAMATAQVGQMGTLLGAPLEISDFVTNDLDQSSGLYTGSNTTTALSLVDGDAWELWELDDESYVDVDEPQSGVIHLLGSRRCAFVEATVSDGSKSAAEDYDL